jgi:hypothetical protein
MKLIYPDTIIWNLLCDQNVDPVTFLQQLNAKGYTLALSFHTVYELGRNFETDDPSRIARGKQLFSYVKQYLDLGIPCTKELWELIVAKGRNQFGGEGISHGPRQGSGAFQRTNSAAAVDEELR